MTAYSTITVLFSKFTVLFVNVSVELSVTTVESIAKVTAFPEPEVSIPVVLTPVQGHLGKNSKEFVASDDRQLSCTLTNLANCRAQLTY